MEEEKYEKPEIEIISLLNVDIITESYEEEDIDIDDEGEEEDVDIDDEGEEDDTDVDDPEEDDVDTNIFPGDSSDDFFGHFFD